MNRRLIFILFLLVILGLTACQSEEEPDVSGTETTSTPAPDDRGDGPVLTSTPAPTSTPTLAATPVPTEATAYTYKSMFETYYIKKKVNVRSLPSTEGEKLGELEQDEKITVTGRCNETGWYRLAYGDGEAYVSDNYVTKTPPMTPTPTPNPGNDKEAEPELVMLPLAQDTSAEITAVTYSVDTFGRQYGIIEYSDGTFETHTLFWADVVEQWVISCIVIYPDGTDYGTDYRVKDMPEEHPEVGSAPFSS